MNCYHKTFSDRLLPVSSSLRKLQLSPYLFALYFCNSPVRTIKFDELDFFPSLSWFFLTAVVSEIQLSNRQRIKFM